MKGGHAPIQIQRWAPYDYVNDPFVKRCYLERDYRTASFYPAFLFHSFLEGGDLPAEPRALAAVVLMPVRDVVHAVAVCIEAGKLCEQAGRLHHKRVVAEVAEELEYRANQSEAGKKGGRPKRKGYLKGSVSGNQTPPLPLPPPTTTTTTTAVTDRRPPAAGSDPFPSTRAADVYLRHYPNATVPKPMFQALRPLVGKHGWDVVEPELEAFLARVAVDYHAWSSGKFAGGFGTWARGQPPNDGAGKRTAKDQKSLDSFMAAVTGVVPNGGEQRDVAAGHGGLATRIPSPGRGGGGDGGTLPALPAGTASLADRPPVATRGK